MENLPRADDPDAPEAAREPKSDGRVPSGLRLDNGTVTPSTSTSTGRPWPGVGGECREMVVADGDVFALSGLTWRVSS